MIDETMNEDKVKSYVVNGYYLELTEEDAQNMKNIGLDVKELTQTK